MILMPQLIQENAGISGIDITDTLWDDCLALFYGESGGGVYDYVSASVKSLPTGVSWDGDALYFNQASTAYFSIAGSKDAINASGEASICVVAKPVSVTTDLRLAGSFGVPLPGQQLLIWRDEAATDSWAGRGVVATNGEIVYATGASDFSKFQTLLVTTKNASTGAFYIDGSSVGSYTGIAPALGNDIDYGRILDLSPNYKGWSKFCAIWSRQLSPSEASALQTLIETL